MSRPTTLVCALAAFALPCAAPALAQPDNDVRFDLTGMELKCVLFGDCFPDQARGGLLCVST